MWSKTLNCSVVGIFIEEVEEILDLDFPKDLKFDLYYDRIATAVIRIIHNLFKALTTRNKE